VWVVCARPSVSPRLVTQSCDPTSLTGSTMCGRIVSRIWLIGGPIVGVPLRRGISPHQLHAGSHAYALTIPFLTWEFQASSQPLPNLVLLFSIFPMGPIRVLCGWVPYFLFYEYGFTMLLIFNSLGVSRCGCPLAACNLVFCIFHLSSHLM
jgi:hypothetical protein